MKVKSSRTLNVPSRPNARTGIMGHYGVMGHRGVKGHHGVMGHYGHNIYICNNTNTGRPVRGLVFVNTILQRHLDPSRYPRKYITLHHYYDTSNRTN